MTQKKILLLFAHPSQHRSEVNSPLFDAAEKLDSVTAVDLYAEYPTFNINIPKEQQRLLEHDIIIFQFPLYWYSTPAILKEWQDLVLEYGFAYGHDGKALHGKTFMCALSAGGKEDAYHTDGYNHYTIQELLQPIEQMATMTGMNYISPFALFGSRTALEEGRIALHVDNWTRLLVALAEDKVNLERAKDLDKLSQNLDKIVEGEVA
ncbi:NAD(P)H-dependent oxidoreductase [Vibrio hannami]|uniref:NAD(P)H-dependent oxidoreductase n=1 Tax=Vibrio hannami TaxID=2717094 RepID=UPI0024107BE1|nr:NAD(P)H-dependent oxidoreductase [Vibrio hannami]MDG3086260.1 NAD(P)H-dependent oxidoreductase [Vibrio hannami]